MAISEEADLAKALREGIAVPPLPERVAVQIRNGIMQGVWKPGEQIVESRLAKALGVGQHVVREALLELEFEGYVRKIPNRGNFVIELSRDDVAGLFELRRELESLAVKWMREAGRPTEEDAARIEPALEALEAAAARRVYSQFQEADFQFHRQLWEWAGNRHLTKALEMTVRPQFTFILLRTSGETALDLASIARQHRDWLRWLRTAPPAEAVQHTRAVIGSFKQQVLDTWDANHSAAR